MGEVLISVVVFPLLDFSQFGFKTEDWQTLHEKFRVEEFAKSAQLLYEICVELPEFLEVDRLSFGRDLVVKRKAVVGIRLMFFLVAVEPVSRVGHIHGFEEVAHTGIVLLLFDVLEGS